MKMEAELKQKAGEHQSIVQKIAVLNQSQRFLFALHFRLSPSSLSGSLLTRDFSKEVKNVEMVDTEFLTSQFVVVPRNEVKEFLKVYEALSPFVVPRSAVSAPSPGITHSHPRQSNPRGIGLLLVPSGHVQA